MQSLSVLHLITPPTSFVVVAGDWPGSLISLLALNLPIQGAFFPARFHEYFKSSKYQVISWKSVADFHGTGNDTTPIFLLSGVFTFLKQVLGMLAGSQERVIITFDVTRQGASHPTLQRHTRDGCALLTEFGLQPLVVGDVAAGGATDAQHLFGFGRDIGSPCLPVVKMGLHRTLHQVLDGGVEGRFPTALKSLIPQLERPVRAVLWHNGVLRPEGLFPCRSLANTITVYCPSYRFRDRWTVRKLTLQETLRLFQTPLGMDPLLAGLNPGHRLPFADQPSPDLFTSFFRQLMG